MWYRLSATVAIILTVMPLPWALAQNTKPWQEPGSRAGQEITGPDGGKMVWVPAGEFMMGSQAGAADEKPVHRVQISRGFWLSKCEVTNAQWRRYCQQAGIPLKMHIFTPDNHPISGADWYDARAYCHYYGMALPTEAQWEYAARGPEDRVYPWGNQWDPTRCCNQANPGPDGFTCPVGSFPAGASWCGALDMAGDLADWCADWYDKSYYAHSPNVDPPGPATGKERVQRGGYCWADADGCRAAKRFSDDPNNDGGSGTVRPCYTP